MTAARRLRWKWSWGKVTVLVIMACAWGLGLTACGNKDGGPATAPPPPVPVVPVGPVVPTCASCLGNSTFLASGVGQASLFNYGALDVELSLEFFGDPSILGASSSANYMGNYSGVVAAQGLLRVNVDAQLCGVPAGLYSVQMPSGGYTGHWSGQSFWNLQLETIGGPAAVRMQLTSGYVQAALPAAINTEGDEFPYYIVSGLRFFGPAAIMPCEVILQ